MLIHHRSLSFEVDVTPVLVSIKMSQLCISSFRTLIFSVSGNIFPKYSPNA